MLALRINQISVFMNRLLADATFDSFPMAETSVTTFCRFSIDGALQRDFFEEEAAKEPVAGGVSCVSWGKIRPYCYSLIRGKLLPLQFKIVFYLSPDHLPEILGEASPSYKKENVRGLFLNIQYRNKELFCTTGISQQGFSLSREAEHAWDETIFMFFRKCGFDFDRQ